MSLHIYCKRVNLTNNKQITHNSKVEISQPKVLKTYRSLIQLVHLVNILFNRYILLHKTLTCDRVWQTSVCRLLSFSPETVMLNISSATDTVFDTLASFVVKLKTTEFISIYKYDTRRRTMCLFVFVFNTRRGKKLRLYIALPPLDGSESL